ncbi:MAG: hypothetical protein PHP37_01875 [Patescibacteria group bacterium]|nr:hypothetical protein [Patescibacteria group bacterium]
MPKFQEIYTGPSEEDLKKEFNKESLEIMGYSFDSEGEVILDEKGNPVLDPKKRYFDPIFNSANKESETRSLGQKIKIGEEIIESLAEEAEEKDFENIDIIGSIIEKVKLERENEFNRKMNKRPEFSDQEETFMEEFFKQWFKKTTSGEKILTKKTELSAINEFKESFPEKYAQIINRRILPERIQWDKEMFKDSKGKIKEGLVSYYPNKENPVIKYVLQTTDGPIMPKSKKFFVTNFISGKKGVVIFCKEPQKERTKKTTPIKKIAPKEKPLKRKIIKNKAVA